MIPKIVHFTRDNGSESKLNSISWEIMVWDTKEIKKVMKKYPKIWRIYNAVSSKDTKDVLSKYVIMREHGGVCFDYKDTSNANAYTQLLDDILKGSNAKDIIYIGASNSFYFFTNYSLDFLAMERNHPIWKDVWRRVENYIDDNAINNALFHCINHSDKYEIMEVFKQSDNTFRALQKNKSDLRMKQFIMFILAICIIIFVEQLYHYNVSLYGAINFIPGIGIVASNQDKDKKKKK
jgi:hypothetical protein